MREKLRELLQQLHLQGVSEALEQELERAEREAIPVAEVLYRLALEEARVRQEKSLTNRLKQAKIPWDWTLESFPFAEQPGVNQTQIKSLAGLEFVRRAENLVFIGPPGTGKSGLACSLLRQACFDGYRCRFYDAQALLDELYASLADRSTLRLLAYSAESCHRFRCESCHPVHAKPATHSVGKLPPVGAKRRGVLHCYSEGVAVVNLE